MDLARARERAKARKKDLETLAPVPAAVPAAVPTPPEPAVKIPAPEEIRRAEPVGPSAPTTPEKSAAPGAAGEHPPSETQVIVETPALSAAPPPPAETEAAEPEEAHELLGFTLGREEYGIEIQWIEEIIKPRPATEVPRSPDYIPGIISLRGKIIPIVELERRLHLTPASPSGPAAPESGRIIVVSDPESKQPFGLKVGEVTEVIRLPYKELEPPPPTIGGEASFITGVGWVGERMIIMLNLAELLKLESGGRTSK